MCGCKEQKYQRLRELCQLGRQRYLAAGGDPRRAASGNIYLTATEQQEFKAIARALGTKENTQN